MTTRSHTLKLTLLVLACVVFVGGCTPASNTPARVTIMTYNIYHGEDANGKSNLDAVAAIINTLQPDLVALQEVDNQTTRSKGLDLTSELSKRTGLQGIFGKAMDYAGGGYGEAVLSRLPIIATKNHPLPHTPDAEPRAALEVKVQLPAGETLLFVGTHLDHMRNPQNRMLQADSIKNLYANCDTPVILAGDLNATPESEPIQLLLSQWSYAGQTNPEPTYPAVGPRKKIDYIMYKPTARWRVVDIQVIDEQVASDHRPVLAVLELLGDL